MEIENAMFYRSDEGRYTFYGQLKNGNQFQTNDDRNSIACFEPITKDTEFDDFFIKNKVKTLRGDDYKRFWNEMLLWIIENKLEVEYFIDELKDRLIAFPSSEDVSKDEIDTERITNDILASIYTGKLTPEADIFLTHWLSEEEKTVTDREVLTKLVDSNALPFDNGSLFRGCKTLRDGQVESYTPSIIEATRFAGKDGYIVAIDTYRYCYDSFNLAEFLDNLLGDILNGDAENPYSKKLIDEFASMGGEDEVLVRTKLDCSVVLRVAELGEWI